MRLFTQPYRSYALWALLLIALGQYYILGGPEFIVLVTAVLGSIEPFAKAVAALRRRTISIEAFNFFALAVSFVTGEYTSAAFIALMLVSASWLDFRTAQKSTDAVRELLALKPQTAEVERGGTVSTIPADEIKVGDIVIVKTGGRIPVDGVVMYGTVEVSEASLTGESKPIEKQEGDMIFSSTIVISGVMKMHATKVGTDSVIEQMAALMKEAARNKSKEERLADRFAGFFLPVVLLGGLATYVITGNVQMTAALFLIVCADDIAVSIPLAFTAALGGAAKRGIIIKGGQWLPVLARTRTLILDKTGTLTYGTFSFVRADIVIPEAEFWAAVAVAEKFSEHPMGRALYKEALTRTGEAPDPDVVEVVRGAGIVVETGGKQIAIGNQKIADQYAQKDIPVIPTDETTTAMAVLIDGIYAGTIHMGDVPKEGVRTTLQSLQRQGVTPVMMTGDTEAIAHTVATQLGITEYYSGMSPEEKLRKVEMFSGEGVVMVGDGINDAPALSRADVGIAMGTAGTAVAVEAADVVILTDEIARIEEGVHIAKRTMSVIRLDVIIWFVTNAIGIGLVFGGVATPAFAAAYNFLTDFLPLANSARLFRTVR